MTQRSFLPSTMMLIAALAGAVPVPCRSLSAQALDSTGMPSLELLALEAGRASKHHPIRVVSPSILCEPTHPLVDSASLAACAFLPPVRAAAITAAFARGVDVPLSSTVEGDSTVELPVCPQDIERGVGPRTLLARITAPVVGVRDSVWEGRLTLELRCRSSPPTSGGGIRTMGKEYLYQWKGREWKLYQHSWWRAER